MRYPRVFEPVQIGGIELKNRILRPAHGTGLGLKTPGTIPDSLIAWHVARARGGVALSINEPMSVHPSAPLMLQSVDDRIIPHYRRLVEACHRHGMRMFQQLFHLGPSAGPLNGAGPWSPSATRGALASIDSHAVTHEEIEAVIAGFAREAVRARAGGMDGVEIHCAHNYLLCSFLAPGINRRTDEYGGSLNNRMRIVRRVIDAIRNEVGADYVVGIRMSYEDGVPGVLNSDDVAEISRILLSEGKLSYLSLSSGSVYQLDKLYAGGHAPHGYELEGAQKSTAGAPVPTMVAGRFVSLEDAERVLTDGKADMVGMVRALIADPDLVEKSRQGRTSEIRPCIGCNQRCVTGINSPRGRIDCTVNVGAASELYLGDAAIRKAERALKVVVVGGGPAGLEAARVAAVAGHHVVLFEAQDRLGGQLALTRNAVLRRDTALIIDYWGHELHRLGIDLRLRIQADAAAVRAERPDAVIIATGSVPRRDGFQARRPGGEIPGLAPRKMLTSWDVLRGAATGKAALVYDDIGHYEGIDVAEYLLDRGVSVHFVTRDFTIGANLEGFPRSWEALGRPHYGHMIAQSHFALYPRSFVERIEGTRAFIGSLDAPSYQKALETDCIVLLSGNDPVDDISHQLDDQGIEIRRAGDVRAGARFLPSAIAEGHLAALSLDPEWQPVTWTL